MFGAGGAPAAGLVQFGLAGRADQRIDDPPRGLDRILPRFGLAGLDAADRAALNHIWHRLDAWPEVTAALRELSGCCDVIVLAQASMARVADALEDKPVPVLSSPGTAVQHLATLLRA